MEYRGARLGEEGGDSLGEGQLHSIRGSWSGLKGGHVITASVLLAGWGVARSHGGGPVSHPPVGSP